MGIDRFVRMRWQQLEVQLSNVLVLNLARGRCGQGTSISRGQFIEISALYSWHAAFNRHRGVSNPHGLRYTQLRKGAFKIKVDFQATTCLVLYRRSMYYLILHALVAGTLRSIRCYQMIRLGMCALPSSECKQESFLGKSRAATDQEFCIDY